MLAKAIGGNMWAPLYFYNNKYSFNSRIISEINKNNSINVSNRMKNKVLSLDLSTGEKKIVDYEIFNNDDNLVGWNKGNKEVGFIFTKEWIFIS
jgi:hypothetical protein